MSAALKPETDRVRQAQAALEAARGELQALLARQTTMAALVEERRTARLEAAREVEETGGQGSKELTRAVAASLEAEARADALRELVSAGEIGVATAEHALDAANRELNAAKRRAQVAELSAEAHRLADAVKAGFESLALAMGSLDLAVYQLDLLDRGAAQAIAAGVTNTALNASVLSAGAVGIVGADRAQHAVSVPAVALLPGSGRQTITLAELLALRARNDSAA